MNKENCISVMQWKKENELQLVKKITLVKKNTRGEKAL